MDEELKFTSEVLSENVVKYRAFYGNSPLTFVNALNLMSQRSSDFLNSFEEMLRKSPFDAYFFETPGISERTIQSKQFEFVLVNSPKLSNISDSPDRSSFENKFREAEINGDMVIDFKNLGGDATLVSPTCIAEPDSYTHIATFSRRALPSQQDALWERVGLLSLQNLENTIWISTSGLGVSWLHVRIDKRPKYYTWAEYKR